MKHIQTVLQDTMYSIGLFLLSISLVFFCLPFFIPMDANSMGIFVPNFTITAIYFCLLLASGRLRKGRNGLPVLFIFLILFLISAYSLNRAMTVFEDSASWFSVLLVILCVNYVLFAFKEGLPELLHYVMFFLLGIALVAFLYLSIYLLSLYALSAVVFLVLGISLHTFVPLLFCLYTIVLFRKKVSGNKSYRISFYSGIGFSLAVSVMFSIGWSGTVKKINQSYAKDAAETSEGLPSWVAVAREVPGGFISEKVLKSELVYSVPDNSWDNFFWSVPTRNFGEERKHDPLIMIAAFFSEPVNVPTEHRVKILEAIYDSRHQAQERLWSGDDLVTSFVETNVDIWPASYLAYTEKEITVTNTSHPNSWPRDEEAIYTFHLPEGSVVTSLSLWINGIEEKAILTTKEKAALAYKQIVGVESRDPSVIHWQEGNTVSVRVFPVSSGNSRRFKVGITSPLARKEGKLNYENIYFDGPASTEAKEELKLEFKGDAPELITAASLTRRDRSFVHSGNYQPDWTINFTEEKISKNVFSFNGNVYSIKPYVVSRTPVQISEVYFDLNSSWTREEFEKAYMASRGKKRFAYDGSFIELNDANMERIFERLNKFQFSLFPFQKIIETEQSLVVTKGNAASPNMGDLDNSSFKDNLDNFLVQDKKVKLFNIGNQLSPYMKSLKENRLFRYEQGDAMLLQDVLTRNYFAADIEDDNRVVIDQAEISIIKSAGNMVSTAPDHLMRLFAYNHILQKYNGGSSSDSVTNHHLVEEAKAAYVVTPVSSLVVLETQKDYDRFDIDKSKNSLENASIQSKGAVPEPHEWMLIILSVFVMLCLFMKKKFTFNPVK